MIILGYFFLFLHENICCGYSLEVPQQGISNEYPQCMFFFMEKLEKLSQNYHQILLLNKSSVYLDTSLLSYPLINYS